MTGFNILVGEEQANVPVTVLRVEGDIDALLYPGQILKGTPVEVTIYTGSENPVILDGKLGFVSMELDLQKRHRVWVEIENSKLGQDWVVKPGMRAEIVIKDLRPNVF